MKTKIEIKTERGKVLFSLEKEDNTIKYTAEEAAMRGVSLENADFIGVDLSGVYLSNADLYNANFQNANLSNANIRGANLSEANLDNACLRNAVLNYANLSDARLVNSNLCHADLSGAIIINSDLRKSDLNNAIFRRACLIYSNLSYANLTEACLISANLDYANLIGSNLHCANLTDASISNVKLSDANLNDANLYNANLSGTNLIEAKNVPHIPMGLPDGEFIGWKKLSNGIIAKLKILADSKRSKATTEKCRCDKALVLEFQNKDGSKSDITEYTSVKYAECTYKVGEIVHADAWDENRWNECSHGIHFFIDRQTAVNYR